MSDNGEMIKNTLFEINRRIEEIEKVNARNVAADRWFAVSLIMLAALLAVAGAAYIKMEYSFRENEKVKNGNPLRSVCPADADGKLKFRTSNAYDAGKQISASDPEMKKHAEEFKRMLAKSKKEFETATDAEILEIRDKFAGERLALLKNLNEAQKKCEDMNLTRMGKETNSKHDKIEDEHGIE